MFNKLQRILGKVLLYLCGAALAAVGIALIVGAASLPFCLLAWAWNSVLVDLAHLPAISAVQAFAIVVLVWFCRLALK